MNKCCLEALERAALVAEESKGRYRCGGYCQRQCHDIAAEAIRSLISPTPVEPEVKPDIPLYRCGKCGYCGPSKIHSGGFVVCEYEAVPRYPPAPSRAEELLLGHEFVEGLSTCQSGLDPKHQCHVVVSPQVECGQLESAHRGKRGVE